MNDAAHDYNSWSELREPFLRRARDAAKLTLPSLLPPKGHTAHDTLVTPFQGVGAQGVKNLASKLLLSLFPPTQPFFRLVPTDPAALEAAGKTVRTEVEEGLASMERSITSELETMALRVRVFEALKHLIVTGNVLLHLDPDGASRVLGLGQYVVRRDPMGFMERLILKEVLSRDNLPRDVEDALAQPALAPVVSSDPSGNQYNAGAGSHRDLVDLYTYLEWDDDEEEYALHQVAAGRQVGDYQRFPEHLNPFLVLRFSTVDGEDYGRGLVEEVIGDLVSLEGLMRAIVEAAALTSRILYLVDPAASATADDLDTAPNGSFRPGRTTDVAVLQTNKGADLQVAFAAVQRIENRLERAFLLNSAVQRNAERVTAEEIRFVAQELESTLGGVFSVLSQELQLPVVELVMHSLASHGRIKKLPPKAVRPSIVTGIEALGRGQELNKMAVFAQAAQQSVGPDQFSKYVNPRAWLGQLAVASGLDTSDLLRSEEEVAAADTAAYQQSLAQKVAPEAARQFGPGMAERMGLAPAQPAQAK